MQGQHEQQRVVIELVEMEIKNELKNQKRKVLDWALLLLLRLDFL